jgi:hypothetical protein
MQYKTIVLELIREHPGLYERLRSSKRLLPAMDAYATELRDSHLAWLAEILGQRPGCNPSQASAEALEMAIEAFQKRLPCESEEESDAISLDAAMLYLRRHTPPA